MEEERSWSGERLETFIYNETTFEHLHRYAYAIDLVKNKSVLDIASGEGYGSSLMADTATEVVGVDISAETIGLAKSKYLKPNLSFLTGSADKIPCSDNSFDVVVSFETIEHHDRHGEMMMEIKRVLKTGGLLLISSPDKLNYTDRPGYHNPHHVKELYRDEFSALLTSHFKFVKLMAQTSIIGSVILPESIESNNQISIFSGNFDLLKQIAVDAPYCLAIASDYDLPVASISLFKGSDVLEERIRRVESSLYTSISNEIAQRTIASVHNTFSYRLGHFLLTPPRLLKNLFTRFK